MSAVVFDDPGCPIDDGEGTRPGLCAKEVLQSAPPWSDEFYQAALAQLSGRDSSLAKSALERALLQDFEGCSARLLPLLAYAHQLSCDVETSHLLFSVCRELGYLSARNAWAAAAATDVCHALAEHTMYKALAGSRSGVGSGSLDGASVVTRTLYEAYFAGARARSEQEGPRVDRLRGLPDFLVAGSAKCGTTFLYDLICRSRSVWSRSPKEIHFFSNMYRYGARFYSRFFDLCPNGLVCGEASPDYFDVCNSRRPEGRLDTAARIRAVCPDVRILVVLRDPALRAISLFNQLTSNDTASGPRAGMHCLDALTFDEIAAYNDGRVLISGHYVDPLRHFATVFDPSRLLVLSFDELEDTAALSVRVCNFLQIEAPEPSALAALSRNGGAHGRPPYELYDRLRRYYADSLADLEREFGVCL